MKDWSTLAVCLEKKQDINQMPKTWWWLHDTQVKWPSHFWWPWFSFALCVLFCCSCTNPCCLLLKALGFDVSLQGSFCFWAVTWHLTLHLRQWSIWHLLSSVIFTLSINCQLFTLVWLPWPCVSYNHHQEAWKKQYSDTIMQKVFTKEHKNNGFV